MRILYLAPLDLSRNGGQAVHVRRITEALERRGHVIRLVAHCPANPLAWRRPAGGLVLAGGPGRFVIPRLRHLASEWALARALREASGAFAPEIFLVRQEALSIAPWLAGLADRPRPAPLVVESNSSLRAVAASAGASASRRNSLDRWEGRLLRAADAVGVVSAGLAARHAAEHGVVTDRLFVVPNGAWLPPPTGEGTEGPRRDRGVTDGQFVIAFAGSLDAVQGIDLLLEVLARPDLPDVRGWIIGDAAGRGAWESRARSLGSRVDFLGPLSEEVTMRHLEAVQAVVAPYRSAEYAFAGLDSLKVLAALASDRPLLVSEGPGFERLRAVPSVRLLPSADAAAWAAAIAAAQRAWREAGRPLHDWPWPGGSGPGRRFVESGHTWDHAAIAWEAAFARAIAG